VIHHNADRPDNLKLIYSSDPAENREVRKQAGLDAVTETSVFAGAGILIAVPGQPKMVVGICELVHDPSYDLAATAGGEMVLFNGMKPRITALYYAPKSAAALDRERLRADAGLPHDLNTHEYVRLKHLPHYGDVEKACVLADGNARNLVNCMYYLVVAKFEAR
jgi:hypothetical protein